MWEESKHPRDENGQFAEKEKAGKLLGVDLNNKKRLESLYDKLEHTTGFLNKMAIRSEIWALEAGFDSVEEYERDKALKIEQAKKEKEERAKEKAKAKAQPSQIDNRPVTEHQQKQFEIIQKHNPMLDDYHVGIRKPQDIKTFEQTLNDDESFAWGDFTKQDAEKAVKTGKIKIYSSYPINQGVFVSTSKIQAEEYAGGRGKKVYEKVIPLDKVAWINGDEGQYAEV